MNNNQKQIAPLETITASVLIFGTLLLFASSKMTKIAKKLAIKKIYC